jgi:hypothetical protein
VRIGDDGGRPEGQHEAGELGREQLRRLQVHVRVDEARDDVGAVRVECLVALVRAEPCDDAVRDGDVGVEPLTREDGEDAAAPDDEVGGLVAARDGEAPLQDPGVRVDIPSMRMSLEVMVGYAVLWVVLLKALLMRHGIARAECPRCGHVYERRELGGAICTCNR